MTPRRSITVMVSACLLIVGLFTTGCDFKFVPKCQNPSDCPGGAQTCNNGRCPTPTPDASTPTPKPDQPPVTPKPDASVPPTPDTPTPPQPDEPPVKPDEPPVAACKVKLDVLLPNAANYGMTLTLRLLGTGFEEDTIIYFDGRSLPSVRPRFNQLQTKSPITLPQETIPGQKREVDVWAQCADGTRSQTLRFTLTPKNTKLKPELVSLSPSRLFASKLPRTAIVTGKNFTRNTEFKIDGQSIQAAATIYVSATEFRVILPAGLQVGDHKVTAANGTLTSNSVLLTILKDPPVNTCNQKESFTVSSVPSQGKVDFLLVIDDSASMTPKQSTVAAQASAFLQALKQYQVDYQIGVTTTDTTGTNFPAGCFRGTTKIITPQTPNALKELENNINAGNTGSPFEKGLEAAYQALGNTRLNDAKCNKGFLRKDADLSIVFLSDEDDYSHRTTSDYIALFKGLKGATSGRTVFASALVGPQGGCNGPNNINAGHGSRYIQVATSLNGVIQSICGLTGAMSKVAALSKPKGGSTSVNVFPLKETPDTNTIKVAVNGQSVTQDATNGWSYDSTNNSITLNGTAQATGGDVVTVEYTKAASKTETFKQAKATGGQVDFLLVVDDSGSMTPKQSSVASQATAFFQTLQGSKIDYQIGVTTTDTTGTNYPAGCFRGTYKIITPQTPNALKEFQGNVNAGNTGSPQEKGLEAAYEALSSTRLNDPKCNKGFLRQGADLVIVFISDENDVSPKPVADYVTFFKSLKRGIVIATLVGPQGGCSGTNGNASYGSRYIQVAQSFTSFFQSICNLGGAMNKIAALRPAGSLLDTFKLQGQPSDPASITVTVNGITATGWSYDPSTNTITFNATSIPPAEASIKVTYDVACQP